MKYNKSWKKFLKEAELKYSQAALEQIEQKVRQVIRELPPAMFFKPESMVKEWSEEFVVNMPLKEFDSYVQSQDMKNGLILFYYFNILPFSDNDDIEDLRPAETEEAEINKKLAAADINPTKWNTFSPEEKKQTLEPLGIPYNKEGDVVSKTAAMAKGLQPENAQLVPKKFSWNRKTDSFSPRIVDQILNSASVPAFVRLKILQNSNTFGSIGSHNDALMNLDLNMSPVRRVFNYNDFSEIRNEIAKLSDTTQEKIMEAVRENLVASVMDTARHEIQHATQLIFDAMLRYSKELKRANYDFKNVSAIAVNPGWANRAGFGQGRKTIYGRLIKKTREELKNSGFDLGGMSADDTYIASSVEYENWLSDLVTATMIFIKEFFSNPKNRTGSYEEFVKAAALLDEYGDIINISRGSKGQAPYQPSRIKKKPAPGNREDSLDEGFKELASFFSRYLGKKNKNTPDMSRLERKKEFISLAKSQNMSPREFFTKVSNAISFDFVAKEFVRQLMSPKSAWRDNFVKTKKVRKARALLKFIDLVNRVRPKEFAGDYLSALSDRLRQEPKEMGVENWWTKAPAEPAANSFNQAAPANRRDFVEEASSEKQRKWACAQSGSARKSFKGKPSLTKKQAAEFCADTKLSGKKKKKK